MMKTIFHYGEYKAFVRDWIAEQPHKGRGQLSKIAQVLGISSVSVSHVFSGPRHLSKEQALELAQFLGLSTLEEEFLFLLVDHGRAGTAKLEKKLAAQIAQKREASLSIKTRVLQDAELDESAKAIFYSQWYYSGVRNLTAIDGFQTPGSIAARLGLSAAKVKEILEFLVRYGLCVEEGGKYRVGAKKTHLDAQSALVTRHHANWRTKAVENMRDKDADAMELFYTGPMTLSREAALEIRRELVDLVERAVKIVAPAPSEELMCLNIDWFGVRR